MNRKKSPYFRAPVIRIKQPLQDFFVVSIPANVLINICFVEPFSADQNNKRGGLQRKEMDEKLDLIARYIQDNDAAFPNSIIISANYTQAGLVERPPEDENEINDRWYIEEDGGIAYLVIPTDKKLASIIDGQHRVMAFKKLQQGFTDLETNENFFRHTNMELLCSVYMELPLALQAFVFATINFNQRPVSRSLAYELFGFDLSEGTEDTWSPEKIAMYLTRRLNEDKNSPFFKHILIPRQNKDAPNKNEIMRENQVDWVVSTSTIVDGILRLISANPQIDRSAMYNHTAINRSRIVLRKIKDLSPLREIYIENNDLLLYTIIKNYFRAVEKCLWSKAKHGSYITKTVGIEALFDILYMISSKSLKNQDISSEFFLSVIKEAERIDFSGQFYQASGIGRSRIKNMIALVNRIVNLDSIPLRSREIYIKELESL